MQKQEIKRYEVTGKSGLGVQNEAGQRLTEFCQENTLVIANTLFQQHKWWLYTWTSSNGLYQNQIDYIICSWRRSSSIQPRPGVDCDSGHELLIEKFRFKLKKVRKTTRLFRYDLNEILYDYTVEVINRLKGLDLVDRVPEELWTEVCWISYNKPRQHIKKQRHHFANKGPYSQSYDLSSSHVQMWELDHKEGWVPKNWWRRLLRVLWTARRSNQSIPKKINLEYSLGGQMLKPKLRYFSNLTWRANSLEKTLMLGKTEGKGEGGDICWDSITDSMDVSLSQLQEIVKDREAWHVAVHGVTESLSWLSDWTTTRIKRIAES